MRKLTLTLLAGALCLFFLNACNDPKKTDVAVTGVKLDKNETTILIGGSETLTATVTPKNATEQGLTWKSDNEPIAEVDDNGKVTAISEGTAVITVTTVDGKFTDNCTVTVTVDVTPATEFKTLSVDANGTVWVGTDQYLYAKLPGGKLEQLSEIADIDNAVSGIALYAPQMLLATAKGAVNYTFGSGSELTGGGTLLSGKAVSAAAIDANTRWAATQGGFSVYNNSNASLPVKYFDNSQKDAIANATIPAMVLSRDTAYMVVQPFDVDGGVVHRFVKNKGLDGITGASPYEKWGPNPSEQILCIAIDSNGEQWFGGANALYWHANSAYSASWRNPPYTMADGLPVNRIDAITLSGGYVWAGTIVGVLRIKRDAVSGTIEVKAYATDGNGVVGVAAAPDGTVYAITKTALYALSNDQINLVDEIK